MGMLLRTRPWVSARNAHRGRLCSGLALPADHEVTFVINEPAVASVRRVVIVPREAPGSICAAGLVADVVALSGQVAVITVVRAGGGRNGHAVGVRWHIELSYLLFLEPRPCICQLSWIYISQSFPCACDTQERCTLPQQSVHANMFCSSFVRFRSAQNRRQSQRIS